ncbi:phospholipase C, phosphocholine-specific [Microlunatus endophyticus]|uniref:phospholipase C n=1 Tax=Microlunatus endophyticus TaxID=1716077 RepID=A0A917S8Q8_9ACTN|nr:phospholipase C, phosphocholine-specific [Microlunatus endophyticus]GGL61860.1 phospholipase C, phosphocholine-specific [Microlunatus endophyticus]
MPQPQLDRRLFLTLAGTAAAGAALNASITHAAAIPPNRAHGSIADVEHIVILMQENRSFDHYFGTMRGVRGFGEPHPATLPSGNSVFQQQDVDGTEVLPFRPDTGDDLSLYFIEDLDHSFTGGQLTLNRGKYDQWVPVKTTTSMAHLTRADLPFYYALADAFTVCDAYHCSLLGPTDPNRSYLWTGWVGNDGKDGKGPMVNNSEAGYGWTTYPERLEAAGVSWKIYQDTGNGLDAETVTQSDGTVIDNWWGWDENFPYIGNYGDNTLLYFTKYQNAKPGDPLYDKARTGTTVAAGADFEGQAAAAPQLFDQLRDDVLQDKLPQVSWIAAPEAFTEHPQWPSGYGSWYIANVLDALTSNPEVWSKTAFIITFDENDGFFDHVVPPFPNVGDLPGKSTVPLDNEYFDATRGLDTNQHVGPYGLGVRVPLLVVSPWSTGGWVNSQTFDHTSVIQFIEKRFGVEEPNLTPWRRTVSGDLTSAFDFGKTGLRVPRLPDTSAYEPTGDDNGWEHPTPPTTGALPKQEPGVRPSRCLGYDLTADIAVERGQLTLDLTNRGSLGVHVQARSLTVPNAPFSYTIGAGHSLSDAWPVTGVYDLELHGPNGFFRQVAGAPTSPLQVAVSQRGPHSIELELSAPHGHSAVTAQIDDAYGHDHSVRVPAGRSVTVSVETTSTGGWYDVRVTTAADADFVTTAAGRLEASPGLTSDPQLGGVRRQPWTRPWTPSHVFRAARSVGGPKGKRNKPIPIPDPHH